VRVATSQPPSLTKRHTVEPLKVLIDSRRNKTRASPVRSSGHRSVKRRGPQWRRVSPARRLSEARVYLTGFFVAKVAWAETRVHSLVHRDCMVWKLCRACRVGIRALLHATAIQGRTTHQPPHRPRHPAFSRIDLTQQPSSSSYRRRRATRPVFFLVVLFDTSIKRASPFRKRIGNTSADPRDF
jgi:hypothetical protein